MNKVVLLTGATGFVGGNLAVKILREDPHARLLALVRGASGDEARRRLYRTMSTIDPGIQQEELSSRLKVVTGDIQREGLGLSRSDLEKVVNETTHIVHSAAAVEFQLRLDQARAANLEGTKNVMSMAKLIEKGGTLQKVGYIGTAFVCGDREGVIYEHELEHDSGFANTYEQSKYEAEMFVRDLRGELPVVVLRPSIVVGDSRTGITTSFNVLYSPLRFIFRGFLRQLPGSPSIPLDVVPVDFVRDAVCHILFENSGTIGKTFHLTAGQEGICTTGEIVTMAVEYFNEVREGREKIDMPLFGSSSGSGSVRKMISIYEPYLLRRRFFDDTETQKALARTSIHPPRFNQYYGNILRYFIHVQWAREMKQAA